MNQNSFEEAVSAFCDKYCRYPLECQSQDELDEHCDNCDFIKFISKMFPPSKKIQETFRSGPYWSFSYIHKNQKEERNK